MVTIRQVLSKKKGGDFSLPQSPHNNNLFDSLYIYEHLLVENELY